MKVLTNDLRGSKRIDKIVEYLKEKNIKFKIASLQEVQNFLSVNSFYNIIAYRHNFERVVLNGKAIDMYVDLDFAYLKDLSIIDRRLRRSLSYMINDIEYFLKAKIINNIDNLGDSYKIVNRYLKQNNKYYKRKVSIWKFLDRITFGELIYFYKFYITTYHLKEEIDNINILWEVLKLRNMVAHNVSILSNLDKMESKFYCSIKVVNFLKECNISYKEIMEMLSYIRVRQITYTFYMFNELVMSDGIKDFMNKDISHLFLKRVVEHKEYYNNKMLKSIYCYFQKIVMTKFRSNNY